MHPTDLVISFHQYTGIWYQIERYTYPEISEDSTCVGTRYTYNAETGVVDVLNWKVRDGLTTIEGQATVNEASARLDVELPVPGSEDGNLYLSPLVFTRNT